MQERDICHVYAWFVHLITLLAHFCVTVMFTHGLMVKLIRGESFGFRRSRILSSEDYWPDVMRERCFTACGIKKSPHSLAQGQSELHVLCA